MIIPEKLKAGDTVALLAPASHAAYEQLGLVDEAVKVLESWGLNVQLQEDHTAKHFYLAGSDQHRSEQFQKCYIDPNIKAILFTRGGYGSTRILRFLDRSLISNHQKIVIGLSALSSLTLFLHKVCGMSVFHGAQLATHTFLKSSEKNKTQSSLRSALFDSDYAPTYQVQALRSGYAKGLLNGGCLSLVVTTLGTDHEIETRDKILFLEDVHEKPYSIDRMLTHLRNAGKFEGLCGIVFGEMIGCEGKDGLLWKMLQDFFKDDDFPVAYGLPSGHGEYSVTLQMGVDVELDTQAGTMLYS